MIRYPDTYFNVKDTLTCGQVFRSTPSNGGFLCFALDHAAHVRNDGGYAYIDGDDDDFWSEYFDLATDYEKITKSVIRCGVDKVVKACDAYKGIRILKQDAYEAFISFIVSQNNNIPRIKSIIEKLCLTYGVQKTFQGEVYHAFPTAIELEKATTKDLELLGLGYRAEYISGAISGLSSGLIDIERLSSLSSGELKKELLSVKGVGNKVADCTLLFGFHKTDAFPVDTWIEKLYREDFSGTLTDRKKISSYFVDLFGGYSGIIQQYLFHAKRNGVL